MSMERIGRPIVIVLSAAQIVFTSLLVVSAATVSTDPAGHGMAVGLAMVAVFLCLLFPVPALILALRRKAMAWALGLALLVPILGTVTGFWAVLF